MIRDKALAASGLLNERDRRPEREALPAGRALGGDGVRRRLHGQPTSRATGTDLYRRSLYTFWKRTVPPPSLATFDAPDRETCTARRALTNTPLQALVLLNDPTYVEAARALAQRALLEGGTTPTSRLALRVPPGHRAPADRQEAEVLRDAARRAARRRSARTGRPPPKLLARRRVAARRRRSTPRELAAWTTVASVILNLDETITKRVSRRMATDHA